MAQNVEKPDSLAVALTWQGRECTSGHRAKCLGPPMACEPHLGHGTVLSSVHLKQKHDIRKR